MNKGMERLANTMAFLGGLVLTALIVLTCLSIVGRLANGILHAELAQTWFKGPADWLIAMGVGPVNGDYELVEAGMAFTIFAFMPLCQISAGHAVVDVFVARWPAPVVRGLVLLSDILFAAVLMLLAWQLFNGTADKFRSHETTLLLEFPVWWAYALSLVGAAVAALAALYMVWIRWREWVTGQQLVVEGGAEH